METPLQHAEELLPLIERAVDSCEMTIFEVDLVSVNTGPGSFTGLRIGLATAKGICHALGIPLVGVDGWRIFRHGFPSDGSAYTCVVIENRRDLHYVRWFSGDKPLGAAEVLPGDRIVEMICAEKRPVNVLGSSVPALGERLLKRGGSHVTAHRFNQRVSSVVARLGTTFFSADQLYELEPVYVEPVLARINS
jgi:tRNA threonylcarbamoyladenosine biosynthesis protein TsaB